MTDLYFNHSFLIGSDAADIQSGLKEIAALTDCVRKEGASLRFYEMLWQTQLVDGQSLLQYLYRLPKSEDLKLVMGYVDQGPHFKDRPIAANLTIVPDVPADTYANKLLHICFADKCEGVVSPASERVLSNRVYSLSTSVDTMDVWNMIGVEAVRAILRRLNRFTKIEEVLSDIEGRDSGQLNILDSAKKSAKRHDFLGRFRQVHEALLALERIELQNVLAGMEEVERIRIFRQATGLEISKESPETLKDSYYRKQRQFMIPGGTEKELFEWHVKIGNHIRIHYFVDKQHRTIYVGHCGKHLDVASYRS
ncbi:hypothetical protein FE784_22140 [Paenibacillus hemerocallicola]|uniref:Uncharacterized protein n=1 Tax=Paenibacillus hemerocallicola TaxID=1172614 RepID=A0A5C4T5B4_9BACL|nr:hypothetical protein [Paenibacillus hemerocallicola]TNJ64016.1 hypothetical protein FE784_22140 [Paenibacillus hemerocallicola]